MSTETKVEYEITFSNRVTISKPDLESLFNAANTTNSKITQLFLTYTENYTQKLYISFDSKKNLLDSDGIYYVIQSSERELADLTEKVVNFINTIKPWYSFLSKVDFQLFSLFFPFLYLLGWILLYLYVSSTPSISEVDTASQVDSSANALFSILGCILVPLFLIEVLFLILERIKRYLFPRSVFAIGYGKERYDRIRFIRNVVIGGSIGAIALSIIGSYIFQALQSG